MLPSPLTSPQHARNIANMARVPIEQRTSTAQWLIRARESQDTPEARYTVERFLVDLEAKSGAAPDRSTYAQCESGRVTPRPSSLEPLIQFWASLGVAGPEAETQPVDSVAAAIREQTEAIKANTEATRELLNWLAGMASEGIVRGVAEAEAVTRAAGARLASSPERQRQ